MTMELEKPLVRITKSKEKKTYVLAAFNMKQTNSIHYSKSESVGQLQDELEKALIKGGTIISIRAVEASG